MRRICALFAVLAALLFLLAGCGPKETVMPAPSPSEVVTPTPTATPTSTPTPTPTPTPEPTEEVKELWGFPIDETHDAFEVPTGGKLGTVLVTVELTEERDDEDRTLFHFSVWSKDDLTTPIQKIKAYLYNVLFLKSSEVVDANFDGYMDFTYQWILTAKSGMARLWLWDEETRQFVEEPEYANIPNPRVDQETQTISGVVSYSGAGDGEETFYRWEDGHLVCFRKEEIVAYCDENWKWEKVIYERVDGELTEISREPTVMLG